MPEKPWSEDVLSRYQPQVGQRPRMGRLKNEGSGELAGASVPDPKADHTHMADALVYACIALQKGLLPWSLGVTGSA